VAATPTVSTNQFLAEVHDGSSNNRLLLVRGVTPGAEAYVFVGGSGTNFPGLSGWVAQAAQRVALAYKSGDTAAVAGGGAAVTNGAIGAPSGLNSLTIGNSTAQSYARAFNGCVRRLRFYPRRLTNQDMRNITA
jgi:hypothetical protein